MHCAALVRRQARRECRECRECQALTLDLTQSLSLSVSCSSCVPRQVALGDHPSEWQSYSHTRFGFDASAAARSFARPQRGDKTASMVMLGEDDQANGGAGAPDGGAHEGGAKRRRARRRSRGSHEPKHALPGAEVPNNRFLSVSAASYEHRSPGGASGEGEAALSPPRRYQWPRNASTVAMGERNLPEWARPPPPAEPLRSAASDAMQSPLRAAGTSGLAGAAPQRLLKGRIDSPNMLSSTGLRAALNPGVNPDAGKGHSPFAPTQGAAQAALDSARELAQQKASPSAFPPINVRGTNTAHFLASQVVLSHAEGPSNAEAIAGLRAEAAANRAAKAGQVGERAVQGESSPLGAYRASVSRPRLHKGRRAHISLKGPTSEEDAESYVTTSAAELQAPPASAFASSNQQLRMRERQRRKLGGSNISFSPEHRLMMRASRHRR